VWNTLSTFVPTRDTYRTWMGITGLGHSERVLGLTVTDEESPLTRRNRRRPQWTGRAIYTLGWANTNNGKIPNPIHVFGPGARGTLDRVFPPTRPAPPRPADH